MLNQSEIAALRRILSEHDTKSALTKFFAHEYEYGKQKATENLLGDSRNVELATRYACCAQVNDEAMGALERFLREEIERG